jgi:alpha-methylacyl-CoA racemase
VRRTGFPEEQAGGDRLDPATFADRKERWAALFRTKTRDEWAQIAADSDACLAPVLDWEEAPRHPHLQARGTYVEVDGIVQPAPAPRFSRTPGEIRRGPVPWGADTDAVLLELGHSREKIDKLRADGVISGP